MSALAACGIALAIAALTAGALRIRGRDLAATWQDLLARAAARLDRWSPPSGRHHRLDPDEPVPYWPAFLPAPAPRAAVRAGQAPDPAAHAPRQPEADATTTPHGGPATLPRPETPTPGPGQPNGCHPFDAPVYGIEAFQLTGHLVAVDGTGAFAAITSPVPPSLRATGQLEALAAPVVREWATDRATLARLLDDLRALEVS